jgi:polar amino acid transport system substrate-binding protein
VYITKKAPGHPGRKRKKMKKIISLVLAVALLCGCAFTLASCGGKDDELVVYTEAGFAPYEFFYNNEIVGVDIKIMEAVAAKLGKTLVVKDVAFDSIVGAVKSGKAHAGAAGITITDERAEEVDFSIPYSSTEQYIIVKADNTAITNLETLKGKKVGVQQGTTSDLLVEGLIADGALAGSTLTPYDAPAVAAAALGTKVDAVVTDKLTAEVIVASSNGAYNTFKFVKADGSDVAEVEEYGVAVAKGNETLLAVINEVLAGLISEGKIAEWEAYYNDLAATIEE